MFGRHDANSGWKGCGSPSFDGRSVAAGTDCPPTQRRRFGVDWRAAACLGWRHRIRYNHQHRCRHLFGRECDLRGNACVSSRLYERSKVVLLPFTKQPFQMPILLLPKRRNVSKQQCECVCVTLENSTAWRTRRLWRDWPRTLKLYRVFTCCRASQDLSSSQTTSHRASFKRAPATIISFSCR